MSKQSKNPNIPKFNPDIANQLGDDDTYNQHYNYDYYNPAAADDANRNSRKRLKQEDDTVQEIEHGNYTINEDDNIEEYFETNKESLNVGDTITYLPPNQEGEKTYEIIKWFKEKNDNHGGRAIRRKLTIRKKTNRRGRKVINKRKSIRRRK